MKNIFRPIDLNRYRQFLWSAVEILAQASLFFALVMISVAFGALCHTPKYHQSNYASYYSAEEYNRLVNVKNKPPFNDSSSEEAQPVDAEL